jgi:hypothetical protein
MPRGKKSTRRRQRRGGPGAPPLSTTVILEWADDHHRRTGRWPRVTTGVVLAHRDETWRRLDEALTRGYRGLPRGSSLATLLRDRRGVRNDRHPPPLTLAVILAWARSHHRRTGAWPQRESGPLPDAPGEKWANLDAALAAGRRSLPGGDSLARLLGRRVGLRNPQNLPPLSVETILGWADEHHRRTGSWPTENSGPVAAAPGERWPAVEDALRRGGRGLPGRSSLARLLAAQRGKRHRGRLPGLTVDEVLGWAAAHYRRAGRWPAVLSGPIPEAPGESWRAIEKALRRGRRGLPGGLSLARLFRTVPPPEAAGTPVRPEPGRPRKRGSV